MCPFERHSHNRSRSSLTNSERWKIKGTDGGWENYKISVCRVGKFQYLCVSLYLKVIMQFHKSLKPLIDSISKLQFSTRHQMKPSVDDELALDVVTRTSCNGMYTEEFKQQLEDSSTRIVGEVKELLSKLGTHYQREILDIVINVDRIQYHYFDNRQYKGIEETILGLDLFKNEMYELGAIDYGTIETRTEPKEEFYLIVQNELERLKSELSELLFDTKQEVKPVQKLKWNVKPSLLAAILEELELKGWVNPPRTNSETSPRKYASLAYQIFEYDGTERSLYNALNDSALSELKRAKIDLPPATDLS